MTKLSRSGWATLLLLGLLAVLPPLFLASGNDYYLGLATRLVILGIAATSLNLVLGYGGMISFGHAAFVGLGAYAVGIPVHHSLFGGLGFLASTNGFLHILLAVVICSLFALITGAICLRTKGVYFIMITMAFAQMVYYLFISISTYGADDGLVIYQNSQLPLVDLSEPLHLYYVSFASLVAAILIVRTIVNSRFGMVLQGAKGNPERMVTMGYNVYRYRLVAYVISGAMAGYAGALLSNYEGFISPDLMDWAQSGEFMFMVILGGVATTLGPIIGSTLFIVLEEVLQIVMDWMEPAVEPLYAALFGRDLEFEVYWHLPFGLLLIFAVLFLRGGIMGFIRGDKD
jgi:branched-chain amino acid transport system permease protein